MPDFNQDEEGNIPPTEYGPDDIMLLDEYEKEAIRLTLQWIDHYLFSYQMDDGKKVLLLGRLIRMAYTIKRYQKEPKS